MAKKKVLEFIGKQKATVVAITILSEKKGQKELVPAIDLTLSVTVPNDKLDMLDPTLRKFLFENSGRGTPDLAAVDPVSDLPNLTPAAVALGTLSWEYEQTGARLTVYQGNSKTVLKDGTVKKVKIDPKEGGSVELEFHFYSADVDEETIGHLGVMKSMDRDIELEPPEPMKQKTLVDDGDELANAAPSGTVTPIKGHGKAAGTPEDALAAGKPADQPEGLNPSVSWPFPIGDKANAVDVKVKPARTVKK